MSHGLHQKCPSVLISKFKLLSLKFRRFRSNSRIRAEYFKLWGQGLREEASFWNTHLDSQALSIGGKIFPFFLLKKYITKNITHTHILTHTNNCLTYNSVQNALKKAVKDNGSRLTSNYSIYTFTSAPLFLAILIYFSGHNSLRGKGRRKSSKTIS